MVMYDPYGANSVSVRLESTAPLQKAIMSIETILRSTIPQFLFEYKFVDEEFGRKFIAEELISKVTNLFAALAIFICCLGLAGLASFTIQKRSPRDRYPQKYWVRRFTSVAADIERISKTGPWLLLLSPFRSLGGL
jgi:hypothetical protein